MKKIRTSERWSLDEDARLRPLIEAGQAFPLRRSHLETNTGGCKGACGKARAEVEEKE
jgi:hypothetical protein